MPVYGDALRRLTMCAIPIASVAAFAGCSREPEVSLQGAAKALGAADLKSIEFSGTGHWFQFGQSPAPGQPWPKFDVSSYTATVDYAAPAAHVQITRTQVVEADRERPAPVEQKPDQYMSAGVAWNIAPPQGATAGTPGKAQPQPAALEERVAEIWTTPQGFLKAALANNAVSKPVEGGAELSFVAGKNRYVGTINAKNEVEHVSTWIDNPVLGDTPVEYNYTAYKDFNGVAFPTHIVRNQGGHPVLDLTITSVTPNAAAAISVPEQIKTASASEVAVTTEQLAAGVFYIKGGSHHSVAVEQQDHIVVIEAPLDEARSAAVITRVKELIPNKPIKYVVNTHQHFDHSGGLRTYVDEGATVVTHSANQGFYEQAWAAPRTLNPDRLAQSGKTPKFETFNDKRVLDDGKRSIEIYAIASNGHNDAFALIWLPTEKILIEADAYSPTAVDVPPPAQPNPYSVNLYHNIQKLKLDVQKIAALHGPRLATLADLRTAIGETT